MIYADYNFYKSKFWGDSIADVDFERYASKASAFLDYYTMGRAKKNPDMEELKLACCAIAEKYQVLDLSALAAVKAIEGGVGQKKSETVGSYSVSYTTGEEEAKAAQTGADAARAEIAMLAQQYLSSTGLLYRGGCRHVCAAHCDRL